MTQPERSAVIDIRDVAKTYAGGVRALQGVDLRIDAGEVFGLLGPNGAGKSTLVKILMTVIRPSSCAGTMLGSRVGDKSALARVGYLPEHHKFPPYLRGRQVLDFYGAMAKVPRRLRRARAAALLETVGIADWAGQRVGGYSKGMRQRLGIAQALINDPDLVLLDEPTDGVDPVGRREIREILARLRDQGKTIFLNSHMLSELEMVCDRVAILVQGTVRRQGTIDELTRDRLRYQLQPASAADLERAAQLAAQAQPEPVEIDESAACLWIATAEAAAIQPAIDALRGGGIAIGRIAPHRPSLEDLFMEAVTDPATGKTLAVGAAPSGRRSRRGRPNGSPGGSDGSAERGARP